MRYRSLLGAIAGAIAITSTVAAQADTTPPPIFQVTTVELTPSTIAAYRAAMQKQAEAAKAAGLSAAELGWWTYLADNMAVTVRPRSRDDLFATTSARAAIRQANPAADSALMAAFAGVESRVVSTEIIQLSRNMSYTPAGAPIEPGGARVVDVIVAPGQGAAFSKAVADMNAIMGELKFPYMRNVYRVRFGEIRTQLVTFFDTKEKIYGANSVNTLAAGNPEVAKRLGPLYQAFLKTVSSMKTTEYTYAKELSFPPGN